MLAIGAGVRLVKGAYREPPAVALASESATWTTTTWRSAGMMLDDKARGGASRPVFGTHDTRDHRRRCASTRARRKLAQGRYEFHMLYGIQRGEQARLAAAREHVRVLIAYGTYWFPWYMRRLAERPANVWFVVKSLVR